MGYTVLWLAWVVGAVAAAMSARRNVAILEQVLAQAPARGEVEMEVAGQNTFPGQNSYNTQQQQQCANGNMAQLVGMPIGQSLPQGCMVVSGAATEAPLGPGAVGPGG
ncbi:unnamed protein product, partial [Polarella glacialis]